MATFSFRSRCGLARRSSGHQLLLPGACQESGSCFPSRRATTHCTPCLSHPIVSFFLQDIGQGTCSKQVRVRWLSQRKQTALAGRELSEETVPRAVLLPRVDGRTCAISEMFPCPAVVCALVSPWYYHGHLYYDRSPSYHVARHRWAMRSMHSVYILTMFQTHMFWPRVNATKSLDSDPSFWRSTPAGSLSVRLPSSDLGKPALHVPLCAAADEGARDVICEPYHG